MNKKFKRFLKRTAIVTTGVVAFGGTLVGGYLIAPNRTKYINIAVKEREKTAFEKFVEKVTRDIGMTASEGEEEQIITYMSAEFEDLRLNYSVKDSQVVSTVKIDGGLDFRMSDLSMSGIELNLNANVDYNGRKLDLTLGHFHDELYLNLNDTLKIKASNLTKQHIIEMVGPVFATEGYLNFSKMYRDLDKLLTEKVNGLIDGLLAGDSTTSATSSLDLGSLSTEEVETSTGWKFSLSVGDDIKLNLLSDKDFTLYRVEIEKLEVSSVSLSGAINIELKNYEEFVSPADDEYVEILNYSGLYGKLAALLNEDNQKIGVEFAADLSSTEEALATEIASIKGSLNVDFDALLDLEQYTFEKPENLEPSSLRRDGTNDEEEEPSFIQNIIDKCGFNLQLDLIGQNNKEYANLDLAFVGGEGYLRFNEQADPNTKALKSVMKLKIDTDTMNWIMEKIPSVISSFSGDENEKSVDTLVNFLSEDLVNAIKDGDYSFILSMINDISNDDESFNIGLDLSCLGIGDNAKVNLTLDGTLSENEKIPAINLDVNNIAFGDFSLDANVKTSDFNDLDLGNTDEYQSVTFLPDVIDQVSDLVKAPKAGFVINGSVLKDTDNTGIKFSGAGKFDNSEDVKAGYGNMTIYEYKYNANKEWATHLLNVDIENKDSNISETINPDGSITRKNNNQALFIYGDPNSSKNVKGKLTLQTFTDIVEIFKTFYGDAKNDPKFTKFLAPITELLGVSTLSNIIQEKDYLHLASNELLQEVSILENGSGLKVVISGALLGLDTNMTLKVMFEGNNEDGNHKIKSINIENFKLGKDEKRQTINVDIELKDYEFTSYTNIKGETKTLRNEIEAHRNENYMNLDGIKTLLALGINTTRLNYYRLTADANINASVIGIDIPVDLKGIDFHIYVDGVNVKVYGKLNSIPLIVYASEDHTLLSDKTMSGEFSFETYENSDDEVGGIFNIKRTITDPESEIEWDWFNTKIKYYDDMTYYHYQCDSKNFLDNIAYYLLGGLIGIKSSLCDTIVDSAASSSSSETAAKDFTQAFTSTGFQANGNTIKLGLNLDILTGIDALREAEITLSGKSVATGNEDETIDVLNKLDATLRIHYGVDINISFSATMKECAFAHDAALAKWNSNANANFVALTSVSLSSAYFNQPKNPRITHAELNVHY